jgi:hypothetical protein
MTLISSQMRTAISRRSVLKAGLLGAAGLALYSGEIARHQIEVSQLDVPLHGLPAAFEGMRVAQLSDIHLEEYTEPFFLRRAVERINSLRPDAVFITGDFVSDGPLPRRFSLYAARQCANILSELQCTERYAVLGNHDVVVGPEEIADVLTANGTRVLVNASLPLQRSGGRVWLTGVDDPVNGNPDLDLAIPASIRNVPNEPVILMCHAPDYADDLLAHPAGGAVQLMLSGHTHGGQIRLPIVGALQLPPLGKKYVDGWFRFGELQLYVNRGLGTVGLPFRVDCPPEITLLTLRKA